MDALEMANGLRQPAEGLIAHTDRGSLPEFKGPSQRCRFTERIVVPRPAVLDPVMRVRAASVIAEAA
jgi:hypothetical protein